MVPKDREPVHQSRWGFHSPFDSGSGPLLSCKVQKKSWMWISKKLTKRQEYKSDLIRPYLWGFKKVKSHNVEYFSKCPKLKQKSHNTLRIFLSVPK